MYSDFIERFRVAEGKTVDHLFFENTTSPAAASPAAASPATASPAAAAEPTAATEPAAAAEPALPTLDAVLAKRDRVVQEELPNEKMQAPAVLCTVLCTVYPQCMHSASACP